MPREPKPTFDPTYIRDISEAVYRHQLGAEDVQRMVEKDEDQGQKLRNRAGSYDQLTRAYLKALGFDPSQHPSTQSLRQEG
jgi:hypothetical protein